MSHGVHAVQHEVEHQIEHEEHDHGGGHGKGLADNMNKKIALIISVLALFLAFSETFGKSAQTAALNFQIEASNLWNFFQAKNIRRTLTHRGERNRPRSSRDGDRRGRARPRSPSRSTNGPRRRRAISRSRKPAAARARARASFRDARWRWRRSAILQLNKYHNFEFASAAFQIGIVLAQPPSSPASWRSPMAAIGVGLIGVLLTGTGLFMPDIAARHPALVRGAVRRRRRHH